MGVRRVWTRRYLSRFRYHWGLGKKGVVFGIRTTTTTTAAAAAPPTTSSSHWDGKIWINWWYWWYPNTGPRGFPPGHVASRIRHHDRRQELRSRQVSFLLSHPGFSWVYSSHLTSPEITYVDDGDDDGWHGIRRMSSPRKTIDHIAKDTTADKTVIHRLFSSLHFAPSPILATPHIWILSSPRVRCDWRFFYW